MKKFARMILVIILALPMIVGGSFMLSTNKKTNFNDLNIDQNITTLNPDVIRGSDEDPSHKGYSQPSEDPVGPPSVYPIDLEPIMQEIAYDYNKTYGDYFIDYKIPTAIADISKTTIVGAGTQADPYIINSTEDFLFLSKQSLSEKYIELNSDIILNDETFDENGEANGGDGKVYTWQAITGWYKCFIDGKDHIVYNYYYNNIKATSTTSLFNCALKELKNFNAKGMYLCGAKNVFGISGSANTNFNTQISNVNNLGGTIKGNCNISGICRYAEYVIDCTNKANIFQHSTATAKGDIAGISIGDTLLDVNNCKNYGNITTYCIAYCGGVVRRVDYTISNCKNYGKLTYYGTQSVTGLGGIVGIVNDATVLDCENYGEISSSSTSAGICGYILTYSTFRNCVNYGTCYTSSGICSYGKGGAFIDCKNYGTIYNGSGLINTISDSLTKTTILNNCANYGDIIQEKEKYSFGVFICFLYKGTYQISNCSNYGNLKGKIYNYSGLIANTYNGVKLSMKNIVHKATYDYTGTAILFGEETKADDVKIIDGLRVDVENVDLNLFGSISKSANVSISNAYINCKSKTTPIKIASTTYNFKMKNVIIDNICPFNNKTFSLFSNVYDNVSVDGLLYTTTFDDIGARRRYIGSDFSDFFVKWQSGRIGLETMEAAGTFYGSVGKSVLQNYKYSEGALQKS